MNKKLVESITKDSWFSVNFQQHTSEKVALAIGEMVVASIAGFASWFIPSKINGKLSEKLKEKEEDEKQHYVSIDKEDM